MEEVQLASGIDKLRLSKDEVFFLSKKANGVRAKFKDGKLISRQGKEFTGMNHIIQDIHNLNLETYFVDGELIRKNVDDLDDNSNFRIGTGIINSDAETKEEIEFVIFDCFPVETIINGKSTENYSVRKERMETLRTIISQKNIQNISVIEMVYEGSEQSKIDEWLDYAVDKGWEGLILNKDMPYEFKRTPSVIKLKRFSTVDLEIVDVIEGKGRLKGTLGAVVLNFKGNHVNCGSGFTDEDRTQLWLERESLIGRVAEIKYKEISRNKKTGLESLQFPIWQQLREVGKKPSYE